MRRFADSLALYGSRLNASTGLGVGSILDRNTTRHALRPLADLLSGTGRFFRVEGAGSHRYHLAVAKIDAEGGEFIGGLLGPKGLWSLCADGTLTVDQVTTEIHLRKAALFLVNAIPEAQLAVDSSCSIMSPIASAAVVAAPGSRRQLRHLDASWTLSGRRVRGDRPCGQTTGRVTLF